MQPFTKSRGNWTAWCGTNNNYTKELKFNEGTMQYLCYAPQEGDEKKTPHWQIYVQYKSPTSHKHACERLEGKPTVVLTKCVGTDEENYNYIVKNNKNTNTGPAREFGKRLPHNGHPNIKQGHRMDFEPIKAAIKAGKRKSALLEEFPEMMAKYPKWVSDYTVKVNKPQKELEFPIKLPWMTIEKPTEENRQRNYWLWGPPGQGKTTTLQDFFQEYKVHMIPEDPMYRYEDYEDEQLLIADDADLSYREIQSITNVWKIPQKIAGKARNYPNYWLKGQIRILIVLSNFPPKFGLNQGNFMTRFNVIRVDNDVPKEVNEYKTMEEEFYEMGYLNRNYKDPEDDGK